MTVLLGEFSCSVSIFLVINWMFCFICLRCPLMVEVKLGRCFRTMLAVNPGQVVKNPAVIALIKVNGTGLYAAMCRYITMSFFLFSLYTLLACSLTELGGACFVVDISTAHTHVCSCRLPCKERDGVVLYVM